VRHCLEKAHPKNDWWNASRVGPEFHSQCHKKQNEQANKNTSPLVLQLWLKWKNTSPASAKLSSNLGITEHNISHSIISSDIIIFIFYLCF
jgi:hypothetical protein